MPRVKPNPKINNETFFGEVRDLASDGRGVVRHPSGRTFFVPGVWRGEEGHFRVVAIKGRIGEAELLELTRPTEHRREPPCEFFGLRGNSCGGCAWQFVDYEAQLQEKQARVVNAMSKLGYAPSVKPILASPVEWGYRNRAQLKTDGEVLGFVAARSNSLVPVKTCQVLTTHNNETLQALVEKLPENSWKPKRKQQWTTLDIDESVNHNSVSVNQRLPFQQGNTQQNQAMREWLRERLQKQASQAPVLELFCGTGNFTEVIAESVAGNVIAAEVSEQAIAKLKDKQLSNVETQVVDLFDEHAFKVLLYRAKQAATLVLDPPRDGLKIRAGLLDKKSRIKHIFYVACDVATFTRDVADFVRSGFVVREVQPVDLFPQTPHVELMGYLTR